MALIVVFERDEEIARIRWIRTSLLANITRLLDSSILLVRMPIRWHTLWGCRVQGLQDSVQLVWQDSRRSLSWKLLRIPGLLQGPSAGWEGEEGRAVPGILDLRVCYQALGTR